MGDPDAIKADVLTNPDNLGRWLDACIAQLTELRQLLAAGEESAEPLAQTIDKAVVARQDWLKDYQQGRFIDPELISQKIEKPSLMKQLIGIGRR